MSDIEERTDFPIHTRLRGGNPAIIFGFFWTSARPWLGAYQAVNNKQDGEQWIPMSWLEDGSFIGDQTEKGKEILSGVDLPIEEFTRKARVLRASGGR